MTRQQIIQLVIFALFIGASGISWLLRRLAEEAQKRAARQEAERRRLESLRTGRDESEVAPPRVAAQPPPLDPKAKGPEGPGSLAEKRRRQLEELRRRQMERARGQGTMVGQATIPSPRPSGAGARGSALPPSIPGSMGTTVPSRPFPQRQRPQPDRRREAAGDRAQPSEASSEAARRESIRRQQERGRPSGQQARRQEPARPQRPEASPDTGESTTHRIVSGEASDSAYAIGPRPGQGAGHATAGVGRANAGGTFLRLSASDLRRAVILHEILSPPVSLREG